MGSGSSTNGNPNLFVFATSNWNPDGVNGVINDHNIGVWYDGSGWTVFNQDGVSVSPGASFNIYASTEF